MKTSLLPLLLATTLASKNTSSVEDRTPSGCTLSNLLCGPPPSNATCHRTASVCAEEMREAAQQFSTATGATLQHLEPMLPASDSDMLMRVNYFYQCRTHPSDLQQCIDDTQSENSEERALNQRAVASQDSEMGFTHERYVHPLVSNLPQNEQAYFGKALMTESERVRDSYHVFRASIDCLTAHAEKTCASDGDRPRA